MFRSTQFQIENRPGLEDQTIESVLAQLARLDAPNILDSKHAKPGEAHKTFTLAKWLSDWHLVTFLDTTQLLSPVSISVGAQEAFSFH
jgi:nuclear protein localization protein 4 homolog